MSIDGYGVLGLAVKTAANLRAALHRVARHVGIWTDTVSFEIEETSDRMIVRLVRPGARTLGVRAATEAMVAEIVHMLRVLADEAVDPTAVFFTHRTPARTELESFFRTSVQTESPKDAFELPAAAAALSVRHADAAMSTFFEDHLARLAPARADESMVAAVADVVRRLLGDGPPKIDAVASQLNMSVRSLQRRMSDEGSSFRDVVDEARRIAACDHLRSTELPIGEIAFLVGFSEVSAFHRAFRRWMKTTPTAFRERTGR